MRDQGHTSLFCRTYRTMNQRVMVVGHNPGMEALVAHLTGRMETMPTAALAHIELPIEKWEELDYEVQGELLHLWRPKALTSE